MLQGEIQMLVQNEECRKFCHYIKNYLRGFVCQYLPSPDQLKRLKEHEDHYDELAEAEQFAISLADIKRLVPRLKSLKFQLHYPELVQDCKPDIVAATAACEEVNHLLKMH